MVDVVARFFGVIGVDPAVPATFSELIPYLLTIGIGVFLVAGVFALVGSIARVLLDFSRWR